MGGVHSGTLSKSCHLRAEARPQQRNERAHDEKTHSEQGLPRHADERRAHPIHPSAHLKFAEFLAVLDPEGKHLQDRGAHFWELPGSEAQERAGEASTALHRHVPNPSRETATGEDQDSRGDVHSSDEARGSRAVHGRSRAQAEVGSAHLAESKSRSVLQRHQEPPAKHPKSASKRGVQAETAGANRKQDWKC